MGRIIASPHHWQRPAATEETAYERLKAAGVTNAIEYYGFAWATLIDGLPQRTAQSTEILQSLLQLAGPDVDRPSELKVTVAQHIRADQYFDLFKALGITDIFWSHATQSMKSWGGMRIHPFPLFPAQAPDYEQADLTTKRHLANFVGAYNPTIYLSNVRELIFQDAAPDLHIVKRDKWHFDRAVYDEQISGRSASQAQLAAEDQMKQDYLNAIRESWFTLCPTGSGPNSIRLYESLALGSIPIVLTEDLRLAGPSDLWERATIVEEDSEAGYRRALARARQTSEADRVSMIEAGKTLFQCVGPQAYGQLILEALT